MLSERHLTVKRTVPFLVFGLLLFLAYLYFFVDISEMAAVIQRVDFLFYSLAVVALFLNMLAASLTWQTFLSSLSIKVPFLKTFLFTWIGVFVDLLIPAESISGDASKAYLMTKDSGENSGKVVASVVSHRILSVVINLLSLLLSALLLVFWRYRLPSSLSNWILLLGIGTTVSLSFLLLLLAKKHLAQKAIDLVLRFFVFLSRGRWKLTRLRSKAKQALDIFDQSIRTLVKTPRSLVRPVFFALLAWFFNVSLSFFVFVSLDQPINFVFIIVVYSISSTIQNVPLGVPGEVGLVEIVMTSLYALLGIPLGISAAATVLIRLLRVWLRLLVGFLVTNWIGFKVLRGS